MTDNRLRFFIGSKNHFFQFPSLDIDYLKLSCFVFFSFSWECPPERSNGCVLSWEWKFRKILQIYETNSKWDRSGGEWWIVLAEIMSGAKPGVSRRTPVLFSILENLLISSFVISLPFVCSFTIRIGTKQRLSESAARVVSVFGRPLLSSNFVSSDNAFRIQSIRERGGLLAARRLHRTRFSFWFELDRQSCLLSPPYFFSPQSISIRNAQDHPTEIHGPSTVALHFEVGLIDVSPGVHSAFWCCSSATQNKKGKPKSILCAGRNMCVVPADHPVSTQLQLFLLFCSFSHDVSWSFSFFLFPMISTCWLRMNVGRTEGWK